MQSFMLNGQISCGNHAIERGCETCAFSTHCSYPSYRERCLDIQDIEDMGPSSKQQKQEEEEEGHALKRGSLLVVHHITGMKYV